MVKGNFKNKRALKSDNCQLKLQCKCSPQKCGRKYIYRRRSGDSRNDDKKVDAPTHHEGHSCYGQRG